jgi:hypothetical protein
MADDKANQRKNGALAHSLDDADGSHGKMIMSHPR